MARKSLEVELANLTTALTDQSLSGIERFIAGTAGSETDPNHIKRFGSFFYALWKQIADAHTGDALGKTSSIDASTIRAAAQAAATIPDTSYHLRTALDYLFLWAEVRQYLHEHRLGRLRYAEILPQDNHLAGLEHRLDICRSALSTQYGLWMLQGLLRGLSDRENAALLFQRAESDNETFASSHLLDTFVGTYLSDSYIVAQAGPIAAGRKALRASFEILEGQLPTSEGSTVLLFSCDPAFFGVFFPYWASAATYLREQDVHLHFLLVGRSFDVSTALEHGLDLAGTVARLRGLRPEALHDCLSFSKVDAPSNVGELRTLYACARFLVARKLVGSTPARILILDIDTELHSDPRFALQELANTAPKRMPVVAQAGLYSLIPAYRLPACKVVLPDRELVDSFLLDLENYIYAALPRTPSWLLDQNALDYATMRMIAKHGFTSLVEVNQYVSVFQQRPIGRLYKSAAPSVG